MPVCGKKRSLKKVEKSSEMYGRPAEIRTQDLSRVKPVRNQRRKGFCVMHIYSIFVLT